MNLRILCGRYVGVLQCTQILGQAAPVEKNGRDINLHPLMETLVVDGTGVGTSTRKMMIWN